MSGEISVTSTTDSEKEVKAVAAGVETPVAKPAEEKPDPEKKEDPSAEPKKEEVKPAPDDSPKEPVAPQAAPPEQTEEEKAATAEAAKNEAAAKEKEGEPKGKGGFQDSIKRLTRQKHDLQGQVDGLRSALEAATKRDAAGQVVEDPEPKLEDFKDLDKYNDARVEWRVDRKLKTERERELKTAEDAKTKAIFDTHQARVNEAIPRYKDWAEVAKKAPMLPESVVMAIMEMDNGADVAYHVMKDHDLAARLGTMSAIGSVMEVARIGATLPGGAPAAGAPVAAAAPPKAVSGANPPIAPVGGSATGSSKEPDKMTHQEYKAWRLGGGGK